MSDQDKKTKSVKADAPVSDAPVSVPADDGSTPPMAEPTDAPAQSSGDTRQLYDIICSTCGKPSQVPFKPAGDRPVFCRECYMKQKNQA